MTDVAVKSRKTTKNKKEKIKKKGKKTWTQTKGWKNSSKETDAEKYDY